MFKKSTFFLSLFTAVCLVCVSLSAQTLSTKEADIFLNPFMLKTRSESVPSGCNCDSSCGCQGTCTDCKCNVNKGLKTCVCADIFSPDDLYDFRYHKAHCHTMSGNGCAGEYNCTGAYKWRKCSSY